MGGERWSESGVRGRLAFVVAAFLLSTATASAQLPDGGLLLVPESTNDRVMAFDPATGDLVDPDFIPADPVNLATPIAAILNTSGTRILVSDQVNDVVQQYTLTGAYDGVFAPHGGVDLAVLDNIRGIALRQNGNLLVTVAAGGNALAVAEFNQSGDFVGNFITNAGDPFDVFLRSTPRDYLVAAIDVDAILRFDTAGAPLGVFAPIVNFPEQITTAANGNVLVANFGGTQQGVVELSTDGTAVIGVYNPPELLSGYRGVYELPNGNILTTTGDGVHEIDRAGTLVETKIAGVSARFIELVQQPACGNGALEPFEDCDDGNTLDGDCCSARCGLDPPASACADDDNPCTADECDGAGACEHAPLPAGTACEDDADACTRDACDDAGTCEHSATPAAACHVPVASGAASIVLRNQAADAEDAFVWKWLEGDATARSEFGEPGATTQYELCLYDGNGLVKRALVPAARTCGRKPCWLPTLGGFRYRDRAGGAAGVRRIVLTAGGNGEATIVVTGKGANLELPSLAPLDAPLTVQLHNAEGCWSAVYGLGAGTKRTDTLLKARSD